VISYGTKFREREDGRKGRLCQMAEGQPGSEEGGPGLRAKGGTDGPEALQRGILCAGSAYGFNLCTNRKDINQLNCFVAT